MGVANDHSIAWGIARSLNYHGAKLAFTYQDEVFEKRLKALATDIGGDLIIPCDVEKPDSQKNVFEMKNDYWKCV